MRKTIKVGDGQIRLSLREEGVLNINGAHILYLNPTAVEIVRMIIEDVSPEEGGRLLSKKYRVKQSRGEEDFRHVLFAILTLASSRDVCPFQTLGITHSEPFSHSINAPHRFDLALTYRCNNTCLHCYMGGSHETKELSTEEWKKIIDKIYGLEVGSIVFTGGEPLLRTDLVELVGYRRDIVTGLITNGTLLSKSLITQLEKVELDHVQITIDGLKDTHDRICGPGSYEKTVEGIRNAVDSSIYTLTNTTLTRYNIHEIEDMLELFVKWGLKRFAINSIIHTGKAEGAEYALTIEELDGSVPRIKEKADEAGLEMVWYTPTRFCEFDPISHGLGIKACSAVNINMAVEPDGNAIPCQSWFSSLGNMLTDDWKTIWMNPLARDIREKKYMPSECKGCARSGACSAGCPFEPQCVGAGR
jgi:radical SAM protein with 4Fe4S-binding SPASM domain